MNKPQPKYKKGNRVGSWLITDSYFVPWLGSWVYSLKLKQGKRKLTCIEKTLDFIK